MRGAFNDRTVGALRAGLWYSLLPGESQGTKDVDKYTVSGGGGKITGTDDSGTPFSIVSNATITYQPGWKENTPTGKYSVEGWKGRSTNGSVIYLGSNMAYGSLPTIHTGYLQFGTSGGRVLLDGDNGKKTISFSAGSDPTVNANEVKITVLAATKVATQSLAFDVEDMNDSENWEV